MSDTSAPQGPRLKRPATLDHLRKKAPVEKKVEIILSDVEMIEHDDAVKWLERVTLSPSSTPEEIERAKAHAERTRAALDEVTVVMTFRSIGRKAYDALLTEHPPTPKQKEEIGEDLSYNPETFSPAVIAASCIDPVMTVEEATELFDEWNGPEVATLFYAALEVNTARRTAEAVGKGSGPTNG